MIDKGTGFCKRGHDRSVTGVYRTSYGAQRCVVCERELAIERKKRGKEKKQQVLNDEQHQRLLRSLGSIHQVDLTDEILALVVARDFARADEKPEFTARINELVRRNQR